MAEAANGNLLRDGDRQVRGSALLAQPFRGAEWFLPRPSAADYATVASGASNPRQSTPSCWSRFASEYRPGMAASGSRCPWSW